MANWQRKLTLTDIWNKVDDGEMTIQQLSGEVANRIRCIPPFEDGEEVEIRRIDLADEFETLAEDATADKDDFNFLMGELYDWGDMKLDGHWNGKKVCWIEIF